MPEVRPSLVSAFRPSSALREVDALMAPDTGETVVDPLASSATRSAVELAPVKYKTGIRFHRNNAWEGAWSRGKDDIAYVRENPGLRFDDVVAAKIRVPLLRSEDCKIERTGKLAGVDLKVMGEARSYIDREGWKGKTYGTLQAGFEESLVAAREVSLCGLTLSGRGKLTEFTGAKLAAGGRAGLGQHFQGQDAFINARLRGVIGAEHAQKLSVALRRGNKDLVTFDGLMGAQLGLGIVGDALLGHADGKFVAGATLGLTFGSGLFGGWKCAIDSAALLACAKDAMQGLREVVRGWCGERPADHDDRVASVEARERDDVEQPRAPTMRRRLTRSASEPTLRRV